MTVAELLEQLEGLDPDTRVVIFADHGQSAENVSSVSKDLYQDPRDGELWLTEDMEKDDFTFFEGVVVINGQ